MQTKICFKILALHVYLTFSPQKSLKFSLTKMPDRCLNPFASEAVYTRNFFFDRMSDSV